MIHTIEATTDTCKHVIFYIYIIPCSHLKDLSFSVLLLHDDNLF